MLMHKILRPEFTVGVKITVSIHIQVSKTELVGCKKKKHKQIRNCSRKYYHDKYLPENMQKIALMCYSYQGDVTLLPVFP